MIGEPDEDLGHADEISKMLQALCRQPEPVFAPPRVTPERAPGSRFGPYRILSLLGRGAFGVVYRAIDGQSEIALKILKDEVFEGEQAETIRARFRREARLSKQIEHPHLVRTLSFGELEGALYIACELLPGGSIADLLRRGGLSERRSLRIAAQALKALIALEENALVHRDIKPANILLDAKGRAKVSDLGLVRSTSPGHTLLTGAGLTVGTPSYMAPEQIMGSPDLDIRCDLYSLGATLFHMLAGRPPFRLPSSHDVVQAHLTQTPPDLRLYAEVSAATARLVRGLLRKKRSRRPATAGAALREVERILARVDRGSSEQAAEEPEPVEPGLDDQLLEDMATAELLAPSENGADSPSMNKAALRVRGSSGDGALFVFAARTVVLGRGIWAGLRLGHRSAGDPAALDERIAPRHARLSIVGDRIEVTDLVTDHGTLLDQQRIEPGQAAELGDFAPIILGGSLQINALKVAPSSARPVCIRGVGLTAREAPSLYLTRPFDGPEHAYVLLPGRLRLSVTPTGELSPDPEGRLELLNVGGALWIRDMTSEPERCRRLSPGSTWHSGAVLIEAIAGPT